ncbi:hypothetical protein ACTRXD_13210 [Nitrospira sp. T9]
MAGCIMSEEQLGDVQGAIVILTHSAKLRVRSTEESRGAVASSTWA